MLNNVKMAWSWYKKQLMPNSLANCENYVHIAEYNRLKFHVKNWFGVAFIFFYDENSYDCDTAAIYRNPCITNLEADAI